MVTCTVNRLQSVSCFELGLAATTIPQVKTMIQALVVKLMVTGSLRPMELG